MSDPRDHSQSGFDPREAREPGAGAEAQRFWGEYARRTRPGSQRSAGSERSETQNGHGSHTSGAHECLDWCPICRSADILRASAPPELRDQIGSLQRDALVTLRAVLDAYLERSGEGSRERQRQRDRESGVQDIPID